MQYSYSTVVNYCRRWSGWWCSALSLGIYGCWCLAWRCGVERGQRKGIARQGSLGMWENRSSVDKCSAEDMNREILTQKTSGETMHRIPKSRHKDAHADGMVGGTAMTWRCGDMEVKLGTQDDRLGGYGFPGGWGQRHARSTRST